MVHPSQRLSFADRIETPSISPLARYLLSLISIKRSNLCVSADVHTTRQLLQVAEEVGDYICMLKTHADIIDDFSKRTILGLQDVARRKHFVIFEDRKFGDIGSTDIPCFCFPRSGFSSLGRIAVADINPVKKDTVQSQYTRGPLSIARWSHITNAHLLPGPSIIPALKSAAYQTLTSLNQSVATIISTGTPRSSLESSPEPSRNSEASYTVPNPAKHKADGDDEEEEEAEEEKDEVPRRHRASGRTASVTTTISQTVEATPRSQPPALLKSLSYASDEGSTPQSTASALAELGPPPHARGLLLLAQMSSAGNLTTPEYTAACLSAAREHKDFVLGFICQKNLNSEPGDSFLNFTPGVGLPEKDGSAGAAGADGKGQVWRTPNEVIGKDGADVIIVGRGILAAEDRGREAERYRKAAWAAYNERLRKT
ncbi:MAG: hypothetical protein Q9163_002563 [Psora crenata]